jgi:hypothetical protein
MTKRPGIESWGSFEKRRPSDVYGESGFSLSDKIDPNGIK